MTAGYSRFVLLLSLMSTNAELFPTLPHLEPLSPTVKPNHLSFLYRSCSSFLNYISVVSMVNVGNNIKTARKCPRHMYLGCTLVEGGSCPHFDLSGNAPFSLHGRIEKGFRWREGKSWVVGEESDCYYRDPTIPATTGRSDASCRG